MKKDRFVESSQRIYARLLNLYPRQHRADFGADMLQVFADQCRATAGAQSGLRRALRRVDLWLRCLVDLFSNALKEHVTAPNARLGLLEAPRNAPLPWKGVFLVLIPGLIFFVSQVGQVTGMDWFYWMIYRGTYYLMIPVLAVWIWKRKFPIWGLMPLGLLANTVSMAVRSHRFLSYLDQAPILHNIIGPLQVRPTTLNGSIMAALGLAAVLLLWIVAHRCGVPRRARYWLGGYVLLMLFNQTWTCMDYLSMNGVDWRSAFDGANSAYLADLVSICFSEVSIFGTFLILILSGALLSRRHGRLAALLPMGFLLASTVYGRIYTDWPEGGTREYSLMLTVTILALTYRFIVAIAAPLWIVRSADQKKQTMAGAVSLLALIGIQAGVNIWQVFVMGWGIVDGVDLYFLTSNQLILATGIGLALALYRQGRPPEGAWLGNEKTGPEIRAGLT